jgi:hypothetical protein
MSNVNTTLERRRPLWNQAYRLIKGKYPPEGYAYNSLTYNALKPLRKWVTVTLAPNCPNNAIQIMLYRAYGFKIGRRTFIGMRCYLDDMCHNLLTIGDDVTISYGIYFACHGRHQGHYPIEVQDNAYTGMRANVISKNRGGRSGAHWTGFCRGCLRSRQLRRPGRRYGRWGTLSHYSGVISHE